jgi:hypothetical protein
MLRDVTDNSCQRMMHAIAISADVGWQSGDDCYTQRNCTVQ